MFYNLFSGLIDFLQKGPPEFIWILLLIISFASILFLLRFFGENGLYLYIGIAIIAANIYVLKVVQFSIYPQPIALGTILFTSTYLCTDILAEYFGYHSARKGVYLGFVAMILMTLFMTLAIAFRPIDPTTAGDNFQWALENHYHIEALFSPAPTLLAAGLLAYLISQLNDLWSFLTIKKLTHGRYLWLRNIGSTLIATFIDNVIFSFLAWIILAKSPLPLKTVWYTYILGTYWLRAIVTLLSFPIIYWARHCLPKKQF